ALAGGQDAVARIELAAIDSQARAVVADPLETFSSIPSGESDASGADDALLSRRLGGRYRLVRRIGHGGMGAVYEAEGETGPRVAVKVLLGDSLTADPGLIARFLREGRATTRIDHPNIARTR